MLEIILAFGNYLNSSKRGPAYGFKLASLDSLLDTKSTDKRMCLLHYIAATIRQKFPELVNFDSDLSYIEKAAVGELTVYLHRFNHSSFPNCPEIRHELQKVCNGAPQGSFVRPFLFTCKLTVFYLSKYISRGILFIKVRNCKML